MSIVKLSDAEIDTETVQDVHPWPSGSIVITSQGNYVVNESPQACREALGLKPEKLPIPPPGPPKAVKAAAAAPAEKPAPKKKPEPPARHR